MSNVMEVSKTELYNSYALNIEVSLGDLEQPTIELTKYKPQWVNGQWSSISEQRKFLVRTIYYSYDNYDDKDELKLTRVNGSFYLKGSKRIGARTESWNLDRLEPKEYNEAVNQLPTELHDYAKESLKEIQVKLTNVMNKGVITNA